MHNVELFIYNSFWYYTLITESCISLFTRLRNHCGCSKKLTDVSINENTSNMVFKKHFNSTIETTYYTFTEKNNSVLPEEHTVCEYEFIEVCVNLNDTQTFTITMNRQNSNFYCVGNSLSHSFFEWYLKTYYNFKSLERDTYSITIIDSNVNEHTMSSNDCLVLDKKTFKIQ